MEQKRFRDKNYKRIVIKVGTTTLTYPNKAINLQKIEKLAWVLSDLKNQGKEIVLVSSGAIAVGTERLKLAERPRDTKGKQATSAVGQAVLMQIYENFFMSYNQIVAQILLTKDVIEEKNRKENALNTFLTLFEMGVIPIVNENDTVATDEIEFGDNDSLSAYVATLTKSDALIILSDIDGLYNADPKKNPDAKLIYEIENISDVENFAGDSSSNVGTGGMTTKILAAKIATKEGIDTFIASGENPEIIFKILAGEKIGSLFKGKNIKY
ncbi:MAG: glutamate 5-kinase [Fusobacteriaceae bacterium]